MDGIGSDGWIQVDLKHQNYSTLLTHPYPTNKHILLDLEDIVVL